MKLKILHIAIVICTLLGCSAVASAQFDLSRIAGAAQKAAQALTLTDEQMRQYVGEYIAYSDQNNPVLPETSPYVVRLRKLTQGLNDVDGIPLNFKVYDVSDVNAFACADGSVRVYSALMDIMSDDELLGVIGHEVGHVALKHSKNAFKTSLLTSALKDGIASRGGVAARLTDSQLGTLSESLVNASYSRKQEEQADDYGYEFLKRSGKNPAAMALSFRKLQQLEAQAGKSGSNLVNQLFSSHPELSKRITRMEKRAKKDGYQINP